MSQSKKKRSKKYTGADAAQVRPTITKVQAVQRGPVRQWLFENKQLVKIGKTAALVVVVLILIITGIASLF